MSRSPATRRLASAARLCQAAVLLLLALGLAGCSGKSGKGDTGKVTGKVTVKGAKPATGTSIKFISSDGKEVSAVVEPDGSYTANDVPVGDNKVVVTGVPAASVAIGGKGAEMPGMQAGDKGGATVPPQYATAGALPNLNVVKGDNTHNVDLK